LRDGAAASSWAAAGGRIAVLAAAAILVFVAGAGVMFFQRFADHFPASFLRDAFLGGRALYQNARDALGLDEPHEGHLYGPARHAGAGVIRYDPGRARAGLTLFTSGHAPVALLVGMDGSVVHEWRHPFSQAWPEPEHIALPVGDAYMYFRKAYVFPDGGLLTMYEAPDTTPVAYGMIRLDAESNLLWKNDDHVHHDFDIAEDGTIYALTMRVTDRPIPDGPGGCRPPFLEDGVSIISGDGRLLKQIFLFDAFARSGYSWALGLARCSDPSGDVLHANGIELLRDGIAARHPYARPGQLLLSLAFIDTIAVLDIASEQIVWALRGSWIRQHDADFLANGHILLFDNLGNLGEGGASRVLEIDPATAGIRWSFQGTADAPFFSAIRSAQQRLDNGNTLITESDQGRIIEVTPAGDIVWEYLNPHRAGPDGGRIAVVSWAERLDPGSLPFLGPDAVRQ
jgi:hypothetical protein